MAARKFRAGLLTFLVGASVIRAQALEKLAGIDIPFVANEGQFDPAVAFSAPTLSGKVFVTRAGQIVYSLSGNRENAPGWTLTESFAGGNPRPRSGKAAVTRVSYFLGADAARWRSSLSTYESLELGEVWRGVNVSLRPHGRRVEKVFTIAPGASPESIRIRIDGAVRLRVAGSGELIAETDLGDATLSAPIAYQERGDERIPVAVAYRLEDSRYGFRLGALDPTLPLVIDPLLQSTFVGGSDQDEVFAVTSHPATGEILVAGIASSTNFPGVVGGVQPGFGGGGSDAVVARFNSRLTVLLQATYLGGDAGELAWAIGVNPATGDVLVTGDTGSTDFPGTSGGAQPAGGGGEDVFVARLDPSLRTLRQSTYLGGTGTDTPRGLAVDPNTGDVLVAGLTFSLNFPGTLGGAQTAFGSGFAARLNSGLTTLEQTTFLGTIDDVAVSIAIHPGTGEILVAGRTGWSVFPGTASGAQPTFGGFQDGFVARLNPALTEVLGSSYLGGSGLDALVSLAVSSTGDVLVAGLTNSTNLPGTAGGAQTALGGDFDGFAARFDSTLGTLLQSTYYGGSGGDVVNAMTIHPVSGEVFIAGASASGNLPSTSGGVQINQAFPPDAFVARLNPTLTASLQATYLGGRDVDTARAISIHTISGEVLLAGGTTSGDFPGTSGGAQATIGGLSDGLVARLSEDLAAGPPSPTPVAPATSVPTLSLGALGMLAGAIAAAGLLLIRKTG